jgi:hypothetical protein
MDPETSGAPRAGWRRKGCLSAIGLGGAFLVAFAALLRISRGRGRILELGLRAAALVVAVAVVGAGVRGVLKRRGRGPTPREIAVAILGVACVLVLMWFVMMFG